MSHFKNALVCMVGLLIGFLAVYFYLMTGGSAPEIEQKPETVTVPEIAFAEEIPAPLETPVAATAAKPLAAEPVVEKSPQPTAPKPEPVVFKLNVPYYRQQHQNTCEAASLRMALEFYGIKTTDMELVNAFGYNPRAKDVVLNVWDDPHKMFVGSVDANTSTGGYGVYGEPVAKAAEMYGRSAEYRTTIMPKEIAAEIQAGHPIVIWGYTSLKESPYTWNIASEGGMIIGTAKAFKGEHARLIVGFEGPVNNPTGFYLHDSLVGAYKYYSTGSLMNQFYSVLGVTNQVVIVR